jgi:hypothetical protein
MTYDTDIMKYKDFYKHLLTESVDIQTKLDRLREAGDTQRGIPESVMLSCVKNIQKFGGPAMLTHLLEHVGDLSHRASRSNAISNVDEKVKMALRLTSPKEGYMGLEEEIEYGLKNNAEYSALIESGFDSGWETMVKSKDESRWAKRDAEIARLQSDIVSRIKKAREVMEIELKKYVSTHRKENLPITTLGRLGKKAAIDLGELNIQELDESLKKIKKWLGEYERSGYSDEKLLQGYDENRHDYIEGEEEESRDVKI